MRQNVVNHKNESENWKPRWCERDGSKEKDKVESEIDGVTFAELVSVTSPAQELRNGYDYLYVFVWHYFR